MFTRDISQVTQIGDMYESSDEGSQEADIYLHPLSKVVSRAEHIAAQMLYKGLGGSLGAWPARIFQGGISQSPGRSRAAQASADPKSLSVLFFRKGLLISGCLIPTTAQRCDKLLLDQLRFSNSYANTRCDQYERGVSIAESVRFCLLHLRQSRSINPLSANKFFVDTTSRHGFLGIYRCRTAQPSNQIGVLGAGPEDLYPIVASLKS
jgi:hypothetical protein